MAVPEIRDPQPPVPNRTPTRTYVGIVVYLLLFLFVLVVVWGVYLRPALEAASRASPEERRQLAASAWLMMVVVLVVLFGLLVVIFRVGRFFLPRQAAQPRRKTEYVDAWAESAKRMQTPPREDGDEE